MIKSTLISKLIILNPRCSAGLGWLARATVALNGLSSGALWSLAGGGEDHVLVTTTRRPLSKPECIGSERDHWSFGGRDGGNRRLQRSLSSASPPTLGSPPFCHQLIQGPLTQEQACGLIPSCQESDSIANWPYDLMLNFHLSPLNPSASLLWPLPVLRFLKSLMLRVNFMAALSDGVSQTWRLRLYLWKGGPMPWELEGPWENPILALAHP